MQEIFSVILMDGRQQIQVQEVGRAEIRQYNLVELLYRDSKGRLLLGTKTGQMKALHSTWLLHRYGSGDTQLEVLSRDAADLWCVRNNIDLTEVLNHLRLTSCRTDDSSISGPIVKMYG